MQISSVVLPVEIAHLEESDWARVQQLRYNSLIQDPQAFGNNLKKELELPDRWWQEKLKEALEGKSWLTCAEYNDELIGIMAAVRKLEDTAYVLKVFVGKDMRGHDISKLMMTDLLNKINSDPKIKKVILRVNEEQVPAVKLYESFGFIKTGEVESRMGDGKVHKEWQMELNFRNS